MPSMSRSDRRRIQRKSGGRKQVIAASVLALGGLSAGYMQHLRPTVAYASGSCTVTSSSDDGTGAAGTLSKCLSDAALFAGEFTITLAADVTLTGNLPVKTVDDTLTIDGSGRAINGAGSYSGIDVTMQGEPLILTDLTVSSMELATPRTGRSWVTGAALYVHGDASILRSTFVDNDSLRWGGALYIRGSLGVFDSTFTRNSAGDDGGAMYVNGDLTMVNTLVSNNSALDTSGGVYAGGDADIRGSVFSGNSSVNEGGGFYSGGDDIRIEDSTFASNTSSANGGAVYFECADYIDVVRSSFVDNESGEYGGAIGIHCGDMTAVESTFTGNVAVEGGGAIYAGDPLVMVDSEVTGNRVTGPSGVGGGLYASGELTLTGSTVSSNVVDDTAGQGGAIYAGGDAIITNSTISGNRVAGSAGQGGGIYARAALNLEFATLSGNTTGNTDDSGSTLWVTGASLSAVAAVLDDTGTVPCWLPGGGSGVTVDDTFAFASGAVTGESCGFGGLGSDDTFVAGDFLLGSLADNGGPTDTSLPSLTSPLVLRAPNAADLVDDTVAIDQRGAARPTNSVFTIGAVQNPGDPAPGGSNAPVAAAGNASATVNSPTTTAGGAPTSWVLQAFTIDDTYLIPTDDTCAIGSAAGSCTVTGLTNGQPYRFKATPSNAQGVGRVSLPSNAVTPASNPTPPSPDPVFAPSAPRDVSAVPGDRSAVVAWREPASAGSFPVSTYRATASPGGQSCLVVAPALTCAVTGLANGTPYTFTVEALNGAGWSPKGGPSNAVTPGGVTPAPDPVPLPGPLTPGESVLQTNGVVDPNVTVDPNTKSDGLVITGDGWDMDLDGLGPDGKPLNLGPDGSLRLANERDVATEGTGFLPNSEVDLYVDPPVLLTGASAGPGARLGARADGQGIYVGTVRTDAKGSFTGTATLPEDILPGDHVLQAVGYAPSRQSRAMSLGVIVEPWIVLDQGTRTAAGMHDRIRTTGSSGGIDAGVKLTPWIRYAGQSAFKQGVASITVQSDGSFRWTREIKKTKGLTAYVSYVDVESNRVFWAKVR